MKVYRWPMYAMFDKDEVLCQWTIKHTSWEVIDKAEQHFGLKWQELEERYGYRIEKVVVLRTTDFEELLAEKGANHDC